MIIDWSIDSGQLKLEIVAINDCETNEKKNTNCKLKHVTLYGIGSSSR